MSRTQILRRQHDGILDLVAKLRSAMLDVSEMQGSIACAQTLAKLSGVLRAHLASEDNSLYPEMMESPNSDVAQTAREFSDEMGGLGQTYAEFENSWRTASAIAANPDQFCIEANAVLLALQQRIERENSVLYPLADAQA